MKKFFYALSLFALVTVFAACSDNDDPDGGMCTCEEYDADDNEFIASSQVDPSSFNVSSCSALASHFNEFLKDTYIRCH